VLCYQKKEENADAPPTDAGHINKDGADEEKVKTPTTPPESTFKKLAPSKNRYTLIRDEL